MRMAGRESTPGRREWVVLALVLLAGALLRGAYLRELASDPMFLAPALDAEYHDYWARGLASGDWNPPEGKPDPRIPSTPYFRPPGYPYALAAVRAVAARSPAAPRIAQFALGLVTAAAAWWIARRTFGAVAGLTAAALTSTCWTTVYFEGQLLDTALMAFLALAAVIAAARVIDAPTPARALAAGAALGVGALVRPNVLLIVPVAAVWAGSVSPRRKRAAVAAALCAGAVLAIAPATLRNRVVGGEWVLISSNAGINLYVGNNDGADAVNAAIPGIEALTGKGGWTLFDWPSIVDALGRRLGRPVGHAEASRSWSAEAWRWIAAHPGRFAGLTARRVALFWGAAELTEHDARLTRAAAPSLRWNPIGFPVVLGLALFGAGVLVRERAGDQSRRAFAILIALFVAAWASSYALFFYNARYRAPLVPLLAVVAGAGVASIARAATERRLRAAVGGGILAALLIGAVSIDWLGPEPRRDEWLYQRGNAWRAVGDLGKAADAYREAVRLAPAHARSWNELGALSLRAGNGAEAERALEAALRSDPRLVDAMLNLGQLRAQQGRLVEAGELFRRALAIRPGAVRARVALGTTLYLAGDRDGALREYRAAAALAPDDPVVRAALARVEAAR